jgi:TQXA domain-containing protein
VTRGNSHPHGWTRLATAAAATGLALLAATGTAAASPQPNAPSGGVQPQVVGDHAMAAIRNEKGRVQGTLNGDPIPDDDGTPGLVTGRIDITFDPKAQDKGTLLAYCIRVNTKLGEGPSAYEEVPFTTTPLNPTQRGKVLWILGHSVPNVPAADVLTVAGQSPTNPEADLLVYAGTQSAIWHITDGFDLGANQSTLAMAFNDGEYAVVRAVYTFLINNAVVQNGAPTLTITPPSAAGLVGDVLGPFTVHTSAPTIKLTATNGGVILGPDKKSPTDTVRDGDVFFVQPGKAGDSVITGTGMGSMSAGRAFISGAADSGLQRLILANLTPQQVKVSVTVTATTPTPTPTPTPSTPTPTPTSPALAATGASPMPKVGLALVLLLAGTGLTLVARRRRGGSHA